MSALTRAIAAELQQPVMREATALADVLRARYGAAVSAILFYGSCLRSGDAEGLLDFYLLTEDYRALHGRLLPALFNRLIPPTILFLNEPFEGRRLQAKVAVISTAQFARAMRPGSFDTTLWARFCQPAALLYSQGERPAAAVAEAVRTAAIWARALAPAGADAATCWRTLFAATYGAELRVEKGEARAGDIYGAAPQRFDRLLALAEAEGLPALPHAQRSWRRRRRLGKPLNLLRLAKAAFTVRDGVDYIVWKLERHSGQRIELSPFARRHPLLAAPLVLYRLRKRGILG